MEAGDVVRLREARGALPPWREGRVFGFNADETSVAVDFGDERVAIIPVSAVELVGRGDDPRRARPPRK